MKKILIASLALIASTVSFAQTPEHNCNGNGRCAQNRQECAGHQEGCRQNRCDGQHRQCQAPNPFEGIELTQEQTAAIEQARANCRQACSEAADSARTCRRENRAQMLNTIKGILTPEQYVKFLENSFIQNPQMGKGMRQGQCRQQLRESRGVRNAQRAARAVHHTAQPAAQTTNAQ